jgi:hypothetical protein
MRLLPNGSTFDGVLQLLGDDMLAYKYTRSRNVTSILARGTLAFPLSHELNDPFESSIESSLEFLRNDSRSILPFERDPVRRVRVGYIEDFAVNPSWDEAESKRRHNQVVETHNAELRKALAELEWCRENLGICSMAQACDDVVMWAHYGDNGTGICVGFDFSGTDVESFTSRDPHLKDHRGIFGPSKVTYQESRPPYAGKSPSDYVRSAFLTKYSRWGYENEVRLIRPLADCDCSGPVPLHGIPRECLRQVVFGIRTGSVTEAITRRALEDLPSVALFRVRHAQHRYKLELEALPR